jgi:hypothetical protein
MHVATKERAMTNELPNNGSDHPELSNELRQFAAELSRLQPRDDRLDRERLAFFAGQASVANIRSRPRRTRGLRLESRMWPAAFAAMSAVAATLLFLLVTRPDMPNVPSIATNDRIQFKQKISGDLHYGSRGVLTTQDVHSGDLEARLAKLEAEQKELGASTRFDERTSPVFTPAAWRQAVDEVDSPKPLPQKSSTLSSNQGINA